MTAWEYRSLTVEVASTISSSSVDVAGEAALTALGAAGWEAYAVAPAALNGPGYLTLERIVVLLKRPAG
jgi:hypothetical protein